MSFLAPLFLFGLAALALPVVLHLIRRMPRGRYAFSSLMFLAPSPPRLTRRSRLDHLLLLLLRALALALLALAFARPFLREAASRVLDRVRGRRVAVLLDTSASMRRADLWRQATGKVQQLLGRLEPADDVALVTFDDRVTTVVDLGAGRRLRPEAQRTLVKRRLAQLGPTWAGTDLGAALVSVADALVAANDRQQSKAALQIVLVSDLQHGARLGALQAYQWPRDVRVAVQRVAPRQPSNASVQLLASENIAGTDGAARVRVTNAANSRIDQFCVKWRSTRGGQASKDAVAVYVPAGQSRVVRVPRPAGKSSADRLVLEGDQCPFDNTFYVVPLRQEQVAVVYLGGDGPDDPNGLRYYLQRALAETPRRKVHILACRSGEPLAALEQERPRLVVVADAVSTEQLQALEHYAEQGGTLLLVPKSDEAAVSLASFVEVGDGHGREGRVELSGYVMLGEIDFTHPVFACFASPRYNDFTKIHFWKYRRMGVKRGRPARVLARFDNGQPALWQQPWGAGTVLVLASGWHPADSQLARSSKFVPLLCAVLQQAGGGRKHLPSYTVNELVQLPAGASAASEAVICKPDGTVCRLGAGRDTFGGADQPGIYQVRLAAARCAFAVNVARSESDTAPLDVAQLEQLGVPIGRHRTGAEQAQRRRQLRDIELESKQKIWRWLIVAALGVLTLETWLAGKTSRNRPAAQANDRGR